MTHADTEERRAGRPPRRRGVRLAPVLLVVALLAVAAATAGALRSRNVDDDVARHLDLGLLGDRWSQDLFVSILAVATLASLACSVLLARIRRERREELDEDDEVPEPPWWKRALAVAAPIVLIGVVLAMTARRDPPPPAPPPPAATLPGEGEGGPEHAPPPVDWWFVGGVVVFAAGAAVVLARRWRALPARRPVVARAQAEVLLDALDDSLEAILAEPDHRKAVLAAYGSMEHVLARSGVPRQAWEAPTEYLARVLQAAGARAATARTLTEQFAHARYSPHPVDAARRDVAVGALLRLREELADAPLDEAAAGDEVRR